MANVREISCRMKVLQCLPEVGGDTLGVSDAAARPMPVFPDDADWRTIWARRSTVMINSSCSWDVGLRWRDLIQDFEWIGNHSRHRQRKVGGSVEREGGLKRIDWETRILLHNMNVAFRKLAGRALPPE